MEFFEILCHCRTKKMIDQYQKALGNIDLWRAHYEVTFLPLYFSYALWTLVYIVFSDFVMSIHVRRECLKI